jgi:hypothetical protein
MGRIFTAPIDIADAGTDADQDIFLLSASATVNCILHGFTIYSDKTTAAALKLELVRRSTAGTGGTVITEEDANQTQDATAGAAVTTDIETPGTGIAVLENFYWEQLGPLVHWPTPEDRYEIAVSGRIGLHLLTNPVNAAFGGFAKWEEL